MFTGRALFAAVACVAVAACASLEDSPAFKLALDQCHNDHDLYTADIRIAACTEILDSPARYTDDLHWLYADRAAAYASHRDYALALADYERALFESPNNEALIFARAITEEQMGDRTAALASYDLAIQLAPRLDALYYGRGRFLLDDGQYDLAIVDFDEALRLDPASTNARLARGRAHVFKKVYGLAIKDLDIVLRAEPDNGLAHWWRGRAHYGARDSANAIADFTDALRLSPARASLPLGWRGRAYLRVRDFDRAISDFDEATRLAPESAGNLSNQCYARLAANRELDAGLAACRAALAIQPEDSAARFFAAAILLKQNDASGAVAEFDACAQAEATSATDDDGEVDWSNTALCLYGRGLARLRLAGADAAKRAEIARELLVALAAIPEAAGIFASFGLEP